MPSRRFSDDLETQLLDGPGPRRFDCGRPDQNVFLHEHAWADQQEWISTTFLFFVEGLLAAYATLCLDSIPLARDERGPIRYGRVGAVKLAQLGVHLSFQGHGVGTRVVDFAVQAARRTGQRIGCRYLTLDSQPDLTEWYAGQGFLRNRLGQEERVRDAVKHRRDPARIPVSMRFDLRPTTQHPPSFREE
jgi:GNAT superfamily N-acetyltransferase